MKKVSIVVALVGVFALTFTSCKKCSVCTLTTTETIYSKDTTVTLSVEICNNKSGAGANYNVALQDVEANGYICTQK